jgi:hypothetical protein
MTVEKEYDYILFAAATKTGAPKGDRRRRGFAGKRMVVSHGPDHTTALTGEL